MGGVDNILTDIATRISTVAGIRTAIDNPPEQVNVTPLAVVSCLDSAYEPRPNGAFTALHRVTVSVLISRADMPQASGQLNALANAVPNAIWKGVKDGTLSTNLATIGAIDRTLLVTDIGGQLYVGQRYTLTVKEIIVIA